MDDWKYQPARDLGLTEAERTRSIQRESGLIGLALRNVWWCFVRGYLTTCQRLTVEGRENLPRTLPFMLAANHSSHLDAVVLASALSLRQRNQVFPIAAGETFFETPVLSAFAAGMMNALPLWRKNAGRHAMEELRRRLVAEPCGYILFPEGTRSRSGEMGPFHSGIGMLIAGATVPVVPCHVAGTYAAWPPQRKMPRRARIRVRFGVPLSFAGVANRREGWEEIAGRLAAEIRALGEKRGLGSKRGAE